MKLNKYFMLGLAGLAFAACSNEDEGNDILTKGTKQISVTISAGSYGQTKAGSGWTEDADKAINPQNIKLYLGKHGRQFNCCRIHRIAICCISTIRNQISYFAC